MVAGAEPAAVEVEPEPVVEVEPGPAAVEPEPVVFEAEAEPEPVVEVEAEPEPVVEVEPEPVAAEAPEPIATAAAPAPEPVIEVEPEPEPVAAEALIVDVPAQTEVGPAEPAEELPVAAMAEAPTPTGGSEPIPTAIGQPMPASVVDGPLAWPEPTMAAAPFEPAWPESALPKRRIGANLPAAHASGQPLAARSCPGCGLSLSASARFCRRCGTPQQVDAAS
jgi:hypothetical protein